MRLRGIAGLFFFSLFPSLSAAQTAPDMRPSSTTDKNLCVLAGTVVRQDTGEPLKKARVNLLDEEDSSRSAYDMTNDQGHFSFEFVAPGPHRLVVDRNGFIRQEFGQKRPNGPGATLTLAPGQKITDLLFKMMRAASISGHVYDEDGEPIKNAAISVYPLGGQSLARNGEAGGLTNDLGEYRVFDLLPGPYALGVWPRARDWDSDLSPAHKDKATFGYAPMFYPNTTDPSRAGILRISPGEEVRLVDFQLKKTQLLSVSGKVIGMRLASNISHGVSLEVKNSRFPAMSRYFNSSLGDEDGHFEIRNVPQGNYDLVADWTDSESNEPHRARREVQIANVNVEGITLTDARGVDVAGRVIWEDPQPTDLKEIQVTLQSMDDASEWRMSQTLESDGSFTIKDVAEGTYIVQADSHPSSSYLKSVRYGNSALADGTLTIHSGSDVSVELTLSRHTARVDGLVVNSDSLPAVGATIVLIPNPVTRGNEVNVKYERTDQNGHFSMSSVAPGQYNIVTFESREEHDLSDLEFVKSLESEGTLVTLEENEHKSLELKLGELPNGLAPSP